MRPGLGIALGVRIGPRPRTDGGSGGTPAPFTPRISGDGDSISAQATYGFMTRTFADITAAGTPTTNLSVAGACIAATENATNNLDMRVSNVVAFNPTLHVIAIGTNDLAAIDANTTISRLTTHIGNLRSAGYTGKIAVCGVGPCSPGSASGHANVNARRGSYNSQLRGLVGTLIDAYIPRGEHPIYDVDAAASNTTWWNADGIHPTQIPHRAYWQMLHAVLDPYIAQATGSSATLTFNSLFNYPPSTAATMRGMVSGLALGQSKTLSVSGGPSTTRGLSAFDTTDKALMNGDVPQIQLTSSASNSTTVSGTYTFNGVPTAWGVKTKPASWPATTTALDPTRKASTVTLSGTPLLTATAGSGGANQLAMPTAAASNDWLYVEAVFGNAGETASGKKITIHDASLIGNYNKLPGSSAGFTSAGLSIAGGTNANVFVGGTSFVAVDFINSPLLASGGVMGVLLHGPSGRAWLQPSTNVFWPGDPLVLDGGIQLPAPLAQYFADLAVQTSGQGATIRYDPSTFTIGLPLGFGPYDSTI